ncbi:MAG: hypothetical protein ACRCTJ_00055 [Brevinema sp.]
MTNEVELITPEERATIIAGLEKGDYTVLDRFLQLINCIQIKY